MARRRWQARYEGNSCLLRELLVSARLHEPVARPRSPRACVGKSNAVAGTCRLALHAGEILGRMQDGGEGVRWVA